MRTPILCALVLVSAAPVYAGEMTIAFSSQVAGTGEQLLIRRATLSHGSFDKGYFPNNYNDRSSRGEVRISSALTGIEGTLEIINSKQEYIGTLFFDNPLIGSAECRMEWAPGYYGPCTWRTHGAFGMAMDVKLEVIRQLQKPVRLPIAAVGAGVVQGTVRWDSGQLQPVVGQSYSAAVQQLVGLTVGAPGEFIAQDAVLQPKESYQGRVGTFSGVQQRVGRLRWVAVNETAAQFELYDLPTDVPLYFQLTRLVSPSTLFRPGQGNPPPSALELIPPGKGKAQFTVHLEALSGFSGPLAAAAPRYSGYDIRLVGSWEAESSDGSGLTSVDPRTAKLRAAALSRVNPNPLRLNERFRTEVQVQKKETLTKTLGSSNKKRKQ